jgi:hypothetical protein
MDMKCAECQAISAQMRVALAELMKKRPGDPSASREDLHNFLNKLFSSEAEIHRFAEVIQKFRCGPRLREVDGASDRHRTCGGSIASISI